MIEFDKGQHTATVKLTLAGVSVNVNLNLRDIRSEYLLRDSGLDTLAPKRLKAFLEYADHRFKLDPKSAVPWKEQFCGFLKSEYRRLGALPKLVTASELAALDQISKGYNRLLAIQGGVESYRDLKETVSYQYHDGFNHLFRDDDFIAVRCGGRIVSIIPLPGNDYVELKKFVLAGGEKVLERKNIEAFKKALMEMRKSRAAKLANRKPKERKPRRGFRPGMTGNDV